VVGPVDGVMLLLKARISILLGLHIMEWRSTPDKCSEDMGKV